MGLKKITVSIGRVSSVRIGASGPKKVGRWFANLEEVESWCTLPQRAVKIPNEAATCQSSRHAEGHTLVAALSFSARRVGPEL